jgi:cell volume regulation protein A
MTPSALFFIIATIIGLGFAGRWLFGVTRIPDSLLLIAAGFGLRTLVGADVELAYAAAPYFGAFALLVILFEGGLHLDIEHIITSWRPAFRLMATAFVASFALIFLAAYFIFMRTAVTSALLAAAISCTSAAVIIPLIRQINIPPMVRTVLELESSLSDAFAVLFTVTVLNLVVEGDRAVQQLGMVIFTSLTGSLVIGVGAGVLCIWVLRRLAGQPLTYLVTFAFMLMVYAAADAVHSSGVFGAFIFGLTLSNGPAVLVKIRPSFNRALVENELQNVDIKGFHAELTFLVRTFFFVFLGMLFDLERTTLMILLESLVIYVAILIARFVAVRLSRLPGDADVQRRGMSTLFLFMPRGLASAVLATLPAAVGVAYTEDFVPITVLIILFTNLAITLGVRRVEERNPPPKEKK